MPSELEAAALQKDAQYCCSSDTSWGIPTVCCVCVQILGIPPPPRQVTLRSPRLQILLGWVTSPERTFLQPLLLSQTADPSWLPGAGDVASFFGPSVGGYPPFFLCRTAGRAQSPGWAAGRGPGPLWNPLLILSCPVSTPDQTIPSRSPCTSCPHPHSAAVRGDAVSRGVRPCVLCASSEGHLE